ncbi:CinA family protein [Arcobacter sp. YIC-464]|uniref:CinA family protein n=1 Tax=Arcobacter sp. YIC-464 TaxID=3376631 RepID=UPI003C19C157
MASNEIFSENDMITLQNLLRARNETITTAESCTGGLVAHMITQIAGSSDIFNGAIVSYSNEIKARELNVKEETLKKYGAVSTQTVEEMLEGAIKKFDATYAIAISGIAGPQGGTKEKPVGTVVIGISDNNKKNIIKENNFKGSRKDIQNLASKTSLKEILKFLQKTLDK